MSALTAPRRLVRSERQQGHLEVVGEPQHRHTLAYALLIIAVLGGAVFGTVTLNALTAADAVQARALEAQVAESEREYAQLVADVAALENPARIREAALELGLVAGGPGRHVRLERNLPADGAVTELDNGRRAADPLKPVLSAER